ncbi:hypothetical protein JG688_00007226 [Phytophthora aleatoria]|uniref:Uncharacterized protein n=1 Tax=Phytophthora aleatoria TaxID=2496075 RepID=A0A8J5ISL7_9STRA|nr:hypothetical protein JG688_00007226 [Phytophthora aleatoria]
MQESAMNSLTAKQGESKEKENSKKLIVEEDRRVGSVRMKTYVNYLAASEWNGYILAATIFILFTIAQVSLFFCDWFLSQWSKGSVNLSQKNSMVVYVGIVVVSLLLTFIRCVYYMEIYTLCFRSFAQINAQRFSVCGQFFEVFRVETPFFGIIVIFDSSVVGPQESLPWTIVRSHLGDLVSVVVEKASLVTRKADAITTKMQARRMVRF